MSDSKVLLDLQDCDTQIMRSKRELDELPELKAIMDCRAKRKEIKGKKDQGVELLDEVEGKLAKALQEKLDTNADYRATASITRDMEGQVKRQKNIAIEQDELLERQIKVDNLAEQVAQALAKTDHAEAHHTEKNGVAVSRLEDDHCTACRSTILDGMLAKLRKGGEIAECPNCHRMMVVLQGEGDDS